MTNADGRRPDQRVLADRRVAVQRRRSGSHRRSHPLARWMC